MNYKGQALCQPFGLIDGNNFSGIVNDQLISTFNYENYAKGYLGLQCSIDWLRVYFDNFTVTPLE